MMKLILASQSPRRKELLGLLGIPFEIQVPQADETMDPAADPARQVEQVSRRKALATHTETENVVVAADTIVVCDGKIMGKPHSFQEAVEMLSLLSGRSHLVMTGMTVMRGEQISSCTEITEVFFREISQKEILRYVESGEPMDKAGAYGIQGGAALFVEKIDGDYYNVMGLPVCRLTQLLEEVAPELMEDQQ